MRHEREEPNYSVVELWGFSYCHCQIFPNFSVPVLSQGHTQFNSNLPITSYLPIKSNTLDLCFE